MGLSKQVDLILEQHERYDIFVSKVEANSYQAGLLDACEQEMKSRGVAWKIEPHYTTKQNKPDPETGVERMSPMVENGLLHIPYGNPESMRKMSQLVDELVQYPSGRTSDTVMALWFAWRAAQQGLNRMRVVNRLHDGPNKQFWRKATHRKTLKNPYFEQVAS